MNEETIEPTPTYEDVAKALVALSDVQVSEPAADGSRTWTFTPKRQPQADN